MTRNWTTESPTRPGWYWYRGWKLDQRDVRLYLVYEAEGSLCVTVFEGPEPSGAYRSKLVSTIEGEWQWCRAMS
jgi:hypothetical protein